MSESDSGMLERKRGIREQAGFFFFLLAVYFSFHWLLRIFMGGGFEMDEAEQLILGQRLQLGYSADPPLYTWLQIPLFQVFGDGVVALALLKNLLLFTTYSSVYLIGRRIGLTPEKAVLASLSLLLLPGIGWESQRDLTHSVLVTTLAAVTLWYVLSLLERRPGPGQYLLLGVLFGLGVLSKWNYVLFALSVVFTLLSVNPRLILRPAFLLTPLAASILLAPFLWWMYENLAVATATSYKLEVETLPYLQRLAGSAKTLVIAYLEFAGLFLIIWAALFMPWRVNERSAASEKTPGVLFLVRLLWMTLVILVIFMLISGGTVYRSRWLLPVLFYVPVLVFAFLPDPFWVPRRIARYRRVLYALMLLIPLGLAARVYVLPMTGDFTKPHFPGEALTRSLTRDAGQHDLVIAPSSLIGGNLQAHLEDTFVSLPPVDFPLAEIRSNPKATFLLVWDSKASAGIPETLTRYASQRLKSVIEPVGTPGEVQALYRFSENEYFKLGWQSFRITGSGYSD
ncbi:MAG: hypothetical protein GY703_15080 [Gammaproteobacteria bacterium]|nr:hypothetical protein [Gammaproteobacteria bacterium]